MKLSGRPEVPRAHQSIFAYRARDAPSLTIAHGPLQRLLEVTLRGHHCARAAPIAATEDDIVSKLSAPSARNKGNPRLARSATGVAAASQVRVGARPAFERSCCRPHAHSDAPIEDACKTIESTEGVCLDAAERRRFLLFATLICPK